jgi:hypothetical protein
MTSPEPVPPPLGPLAAIVTTEGTTLSATEVTGQALAVDDAAEVPELTLEPDDCVTPTMTPPTTPPTTSAVPNATHTSHRRGPRECLGSPTTPLIPAAETLAALGKGTSLTRLSSNPGNPAILTVAYDPGPLQPAANATARRRRRSRPPQARSRPTAWRERGLTAPCGRPSGCARSRGSCQKLKTTGAETRPASTGWPHNRRLVRGAGSRP